MVLVLLHLDGDGRLADTACWRRCHASIKSRQASPIGDERQNKSRSDRRSGRQPQRESARRRSGTSLQRRTSPTPRITTASLIATVSDDRSWPHVIPPHTAGLVQFAANAWLERNGWSEGRLDS